MNTTYVYELNDEQKDLYQYAFTDGNQWDDNGGETDGNAWLLDTADTNADEDAWMEQHHITAQEAVSRDYDAENDKDLLSEACSTRSWTGWQGIGTVLIICDHDDIALFELREALAVNYALKTSQADRIHLDDHWTQIGRDQAKEDYYNHYERTNLSIAGTLAEALADVHETDDKEEYRVRAQKAYEEGYEAERESLRRDAVNENKLAQCARDK